MLYAIVTTPQSGAPAVELFDTPDDMPALPFVLTHLWEMVEGCAPDAEENYLDGWDAVLTEIEHDRDRACNLDDAGVSYNLPDGSRLETTKLDADTLDAMARGFVRALLWTQAMPLPPYTVQQDGENWTVHQTGVPMPDETFLTLDRAQECADHLNEDDDDYTGETGGLEDREPTAELVEAARLLCARFYAANMADVQTHMDALGDPDGGHHGEYVGHTFYLDAGGSGVSFTDRAPSMVSPSTDDVQLSLVLARLSDSARSFGEVEHMDAFELADGTVGL